MVAKGAVWSLTALRYCSASSQLLVPPTFLAPRLSSPVALSHVLNRPSSSRLPLPSSAPFRRHIATATTTSSFLSSSSSNPLPAEDTIFALATSPGPPSGIAIIRISGPSTTHLYFSLTLSSHLLPYSRLPPARKLVLRNLHHPLTRSLLDAAAVIYFPHGASYTGEESLELHIHGGPATIRDVLDAIGEVKDAPTRVRPAEAGEFTRRAFENGRLDMASAEALHALISAETTVQRQLALFGTSGLQTARYDAIRAELLSAMALVEALIDFSDEDGVEDGTWAKALRSVASMRELVLSELGGSSGDAKGKESVGEILTNGIRLAIYGPPNAGKSSLLNRLADRNAAIVSDIPGTTRDVLQVHLDLGGYKVVVYDTAGLRETGRETSEEVERIGIERAREVVKAADMALLVLPADQAIQQVETLRPLAYKKADEDLVFYNKTDLLSSDHVKGGANTEGRTLWRGSVKTGEGMTELIGGLADLIARRYALRQSEAPLITQSRHRFHLQQCLEHLEHFQRLAAVGEDRGGPDLVLAAEELRHAAKAVGKVTGRDVSPDEILGSIFSTFCIGK